MAVNQSLTPYFDDHAEDKKFLKILFKPGYSVQVRELNQLQTLLQEQIKRLGTHIFKNGSAVLRGTQHYDNELKSVKLSGTISETMLTSWIDTVVVDQANADNQLKVITWMKFDDEYYLVYKGIQPLTIPTNIVRLNETGTDNEYVTVTTGTVENDCAIFGVDEGVYFAGGYFIKVDKQLVTLNLFSNEFTGYVGFLVDEKVVTINDDSSLLDNASGTPNFAAPGADRLAIDLILTQYDNPLVFPANFISLAEINSGVLKQPVQPEVKYNVLDDQLARRTYDESGDYFTKPFQVELLEHQGTVISGTISVTSGTNTVLGAGTKFLSEMAVDSTLRIGTDMIPIAAIVSDTQLTLARNYLGTTLTDYQAMVKNEYQFTANILSGAGYVRGYEFATSDSTPLTINRGRHSIDVDNVSLYMNYGNHVYVNTLKGEFNISAIEPVDLHMSSSVINSTTKIGTARVKQIDYVTSTLFDMYLFGVSMSAVSGQCSGNATTFDSIILHSGALATDELYVGSYVKLTNDTPLGISDTFSRKIIAYNGSTKVATLDRPFLLKPTTSTTFTITYNPASIRAVSSANSSAIVDGQSRKTRSFGAVSYKETEFAENDQALNTLVFKTLHSAIVPKAHPTQAITGITYSYSKTFSTLSWTGSPGNYSTVISLGAGSSVFVSSANITLTGADAAKYFIAADANGVITLSSVVISASGKTATLYTAAGSAPATTNVLAKIYSGITTAKQRAIIRPELINGIPSLSGSSWISGNGKTQVYQDVGGTPTGMIALITPNKTPGEADNLYVSAVHKLQGDFEARFGYFTSNVDSSKMSFKVIDSSNPADFNDPSKDITSSYVLDDGQTANYWGHAKLILKDNYPVPTSSTILVGVTMFVDGTAAGTTGGYYSLDSYIQTLSVGDATYNNAYEMIPYFEANTGTVALRDCIDFRPTLKHCVNSSSSASDWNSIILPYSDQTLLMNYSYFIGRKDKVVININRQFTHIQGDPSVAPRTPREGATDLLLYELTIPAYTFFTKDIGVRTMNYKRYRMQDIGNLEKRIENLEYYSSLSLLEKETKNMSIKDTQTELEMFKTGFLVDSFTSHRIGDVVDEDYDCSVDVSKGELRPAFYQVYQEAEISELSATTTPIRHVADRVVTLPYSIEYIINQANFSNYHTVNPFNTTQYVGKMQIDPESDVWVDTSKNPTPLSANLYGENDGWTNGKRYGFGTEWGSWNTKVTSTDSKEQIKIPERDVDVTINMNISQSQTNKTITKPDGTTEVVQSTTVTMNPVQTVTTNYKV
jgi:hypothetical protein